MILRVLFVIFFARAVSGFNVIILFFFSFSCPFRGPVCFGPLLKDRLPLPVAPFVGVLAPEPARIPALLFPFIGSFGAGARVAPPFPIPAKSRPATPQG